MNQALHLKDHLIDMVAVALLVLICLFAYRDRVKKLDLNKGEKARLIREAYGIGVIAFAIINLLIGALFY